MKAEQKKIKAKKEDLAEFKVNELKDMLKANGQPCTGNKGELVARVAEGQVRGAIPKCPKCHGGNLDYSESK